MGMRVLYPFSLLSVVILLSSTFSWFIRSQMWGSDILKPSVLLRGTVFFLYYQIPLWIDTFSLVLLMEILQENIMEYI